MTQLLQRHAEPFAQEVLSTFPAAVIQGARQVGKSTFARMLANRNGRNALSLTLDDEPMRAAAIEDPLAFVDQSPNGLLIVDEIQRAPQLILAIKASIDRDRRPGRFLLTGSSDLLKMERTPDSLAGRAVTIPLLGFSQGEAQNRHDDFADRIRGGMDIAGFSTGVARADYVPMLAAGGYPEVQSLSDRLRNTWLDAYVERIVQRDASDVARFNDPSRLASILRLMAANQAGELVKARVAHDGGVPASSIDTYLDTLETLFLIEKLPPWTPNLTSREAAKPKVAVTDSALAMRLARVTEQQLLSPVAATQLGPFIEGFVVAELVKQRSWSKEEFELFHYRNRDGLEVDLIIEFADGAVIGLEVKSSSTLRGEHFRGLKVLRDRLGDRFLGGIVLNTATSGHAFASKLWGLPISALWEA